MQAPDVYRRQATSRGRYAALLPVLVVAGLMTHACPLQAQTEAGTSRVISPDHQAVRDRDRIAILRDELAKSQAQLADLARRSAERRAASDTHGATEAETQRVRTLGDIVALEREIAVASQKATPTGVVEAVAAQGSKGPAASGKHGATPWWDVYGRSSRNDPSASISLAPPSGPVPTRSSSDSGVSP